MIYFLYFLTYNITKKNICEIHQKLYKNIYSYLFYLFKVLRLLCSVFQMYSLQDVIQMTHKFFNVTQEYKDPVITFRIILFY